MSLLTKSIIDTVHEAYEVQSRTNLGAVCIMKQSPSHQSLVILGCCLSVMLAEKSLICNEPCFIVIASKNLITLLVLAFAFKLKD